MSEAALGRIYEDGEVVIRQGDVGEHMYVVQSGTVEVLRVEDGRETMLREAGRNEVFGEMAIFDRQPRSATVRAKGRARILTLDKRNFLRRINEDPSLAFRMIETMSHRVRDLSHKVSELEAAVAALSGQPDGGDGSSGG